jgi:hypothetical protein
MKSRIWSLSVLATFTVLLAFGAPIAAWAKTFTYQFQPPSAGLPSQGRQPS